MHTSGVAAMKIAEIGNLWYKFTPKGYIPLSDFLQNLVWGRESQDPTIMQNFAVVVALKMWA